MNEHMFKISKYILNKEIHTNADYRPVKKSKSSYCYSIEIQECIKYVKYLVCANLFNKIMQKIILKVCKKIIK